MKLLTHKARLLSLMLSICLLAGLLEPLAPVQASSPGLTPLEKAQNQLELLSPEEKVGQLFLVTFEGSSPSDDSDIHQLITRYHVGGVILDRENDNFGSTDNLVEDTWSLINDLQWMEYNASNLPDNDVLSSRQQGSAYVPLLIGLSQEGNRSQHTQLITGVSPLPSHMALGATWDPNLAEQAGAQIGQELSALGINLLLGPSLDVLSVPKPNQPSDLGTRSFGGDPYWVSKMGQAFIRGVHEGSEDQVAVVGKYFPGLGSSDRLPDKEIATVRKSLEQLQQIDLAPFFSVTGGAPNDESRVEALLNSHIRYQGLQGNIRATTRPISLDPQAFELLMSLDPLGTWRQNGGLVISDNLGSQALRQLYAPTGEGFNIRQVALDAFIAGNDILYLGNTGEQDRPLSLANIDNTLTFFIQKYQADQNFADRVDESVLRILSLKYSLYDYFNITSVLRSHNFLADIGSGTIANQAARNAATLISPSLTNLNDVLQSPPRLNERLVVITDVAQEYLCEDCPPVTTLGRTDLQDAMLRLYGPESGRQVMPSNITSHTYQDVINLLDFPEKMEVLESSLSSADWIIFISREISGERPVSFALHRLLSERQDLLRNKTVVVFAMNAPYYLDATNISKLTAFFGIYSQLPAFVDVAARILFKEIPSPPGSLPVSVRGIGYDLISATSPDPDQDIPLYLGGRPPDNVSEGPSEPTAAVPRYKVGDAVVVETGQILDHNGHSVPDGTPVQFLITSQGQTTPLTTVQTQNGFASTSFIIEQSQDLEIQAVSSPARSQPVSLKVQSDPASEDQARPTTTQVFSTLTPTPEPSSTPVLSSSLEPEPPPEQWLKLRVWFLALLTVLVVSLFAYQLGAILGMVRYGIKWAVSSFISGLLVYNYLLLDFPGADLLTSASDLSLGFGITIFLGALFGWLASALYLHFSPQKKSLQDSR